MFKMISPLLLASVFLLHSQLAFSMSTPNSVNYVGAVVEYHPITEGDDGQMIAEANADNYRTIIKSALTYNVDIIVFPEFGLTSRPKDEKTGREKIFSEREYRDYYRNTASYIPSPNDTVVLCDTDSKYAKSLQSISCAAKEYKMYVVVNHHERVDCAKSEHCASDGFLLYNTNVVFDRNGRIVARYRKYNMFGEVGTNRTEYPESSTFLADFGVTFGQLICFDALNEAPTSMYRMDQNVTDILYSTRLLDELPFLSTVQAQAAFAYGADVNLLAASYSDASTKSGGSGIYAGKSGPIRLYHPFETTNALIVAEIPKLNRRFRVEDVNLDGLRTVHVFKQAEVPTVSGITPRPTNPAQRFDQEDLRAYTTSVIDPAQGSHITTLCDRKLCCDFHLEISYDKDLAAQANVKQYKYRLAVFNGVRRFANASTAGLEVCSLISCTGDSVESCGSLFSDSNNLVNPVSFDSLIITRRVDLTRRSFYMPSTLVNDGLQPMNTSDYAYLASGQKNSSLLMMYLVTPRNDIMTFGIYGRRYDRDGEEETKVPSGANNVIPPVIIVFLMIVMSRIFS